MAAMAIHCSQRERRAEEAERDVDERFKCAWMAKHVGEEFDGVVTGVTSFGLFVELDESNVSGLVHISQLANDYYHFDATRKLLKGERTGAQFRLGDHVRIQVLRASLEDRKIDFRLVSPRTPATPPAGSGKAYDYAAAGERYSLPKKAAAATGTPGMFGRAAKAIGRAFGRKQAPTPVPAPAPAPRKAGDNPPPRAQPAAARRPAAAPSPGRKAGSPPSGRRSGKGGSSRRGPAPAGASPGTSKKPGGRKPKPKGKS
jgi:ribonuclease R